MNVMNKDEILDLVLERFRVSEKAREASYAIEKVDPRLHKFWNLVISEIRLYLIKCKENIEL